MHSETSITVFYLLCGALLLWHMIRGWRAGPARMAVAFGAIAAGYLAAIFAGDLLVPPLRAILGFPDIIVLGISRAVVGCAGYFLILGIGAVLFKRTGQQGVGLLRLLYGLSGAVLGLLFGVLLVFALTIAVRFMGALAEGALATAADVHTARDATAALANELLSTSISWKKSLEDGAAGPVLKVADPLPSRDYERMTRLGRVIAQPETMRRLLEAPGVKPLARDPRLQAIALNPDVVKLATQHDYASLLRQPQVVEFLNDPAVIAKLKEVDIDAALAYALSEKPPSTAP